MTASVSEKLAEVYRDVGMSEFEHKDLRIPLGSGIQKFHKSGYFQRTGHTTQGASVWQLSQKGKDAALRHIGQTAMQLLYIAGPYSADSLHGIERNILAASEAALHAWRQGWAVICPHKNTAGFQHVQDIPDRTWYEGDLEMLRRCDAIWLLPGWEDSQGASAEAELARQIGLQVYEGVEVPQIQS